MSIFKNSFALVLLVAFAALFNTNTVTAQTGTPKQELFVQANDVEVLIGMLLPAVQKVREAAARTSLKKKLLDTKALAEKIKRAGPNMSDVQFAQFNRDSDVDGRDFLVWQRTYAPKLTCIQECGKAFGNTFAGKACILNCISTWITSQSGEEN